VLLRDYGLGRLHLSALLTGFWNMTLGYMSHLHSSSTPNLSFLPYRLVGGTSSQVTPLPTTLFFHKKHFSGPSHLFA
jgi:hypothetical protein